MASLDEQWLQDIAESMGIPALSPNVVKMILPVVDAHIKKITQQAHKFQRRSKAQSMTVEDINAALVMNNIEPIYGLSKPEHAQLLRAAVADNGAPSSSSSKPNALSSKNMINLVEFGKNSALAPCPLKPEVSLHWLAVNGNQPMTADNPSVVVNDAEEQPTLLPKELQNLYARIVGIILSTDGKAETGLGAVLHVLRTDTGIQDLTPYLSRCFYQQIRANNKRLPLLSTIVAAVKALLRNPAVELEFHLPQLMPAVFTCVVAAKLSASSAEDHWALRSEAADVIALIATKYSAQLPDLHARICKTYLDALAPDKNLGTLYGAIVGLSALGSSIVKSVLLPHLQGIQDHLHRARSGTNPVAAASAGTATTAVTAAATQAVAPTGGEAPGGAQPTGSAGEKRKRSASLDQSAATAGAVPQQSAGPVKYNRAAAARRMQEEHDVSMCRQALLRALGKYVVHSLKLPDLGRVSNVGALQSPPLCDLEEALVPYFASASRQDYYCRLFI